MVLSSVRTTRERTPSSIFSAPVTVGRHRGTGTICTRPPPQSLRYRISRVLPYSPRGIYDVRIMSAVPRPSERALFAHVLKFPNIRNSVSRTDISVLVYVTLVYCRIISVLRGSEFEKAVAYALQRLHSPDLQLINEQESSLRAVLSGKDTFIWLSTGFGKSLCYTALQAGPPA